MSRWFNAHPIAIFLPLYILIVVCAECAVRYAWSGYKSPDQQNVIPDTRFHHGYRPDIAFTTHPSPGDRFAPAHNSINRLGMRGPVPGEKVGTRVLLLGDSFVQADEVDFALTFGQLLNRHFAPQIEFVSHGMVSWSPTPEFSWLYHQGLSLHPDEVVLFLCSNDFYRVGAFHQTDAAYRQQAIYRNGIPISYQLAAPSPWKQTLRHSGLIQLLRTSYSELGLRWRRTQPSSLPTIRDEIVHLAQPPEKWPPELYDNVRATLDVVASIHAYLKENQVEMHLALVPLPFAWPDETPVGKQHPLYGWPADFSVSQTGIKEYTRAFARRQDINWIDLQSAFDRHKERTNDRLFNRADGHWNAAGHRVVSNALRTHFSGGVAR